jgi:dTDP-4-amino-4,6-dideoxygalactose transaminase
MGKRNIPISLPFTGEEEWQAIKEPIMTGWLTAGPKVREFEELFAKRHNVKHAMAVTSATTALHLALVALGIKEGDEVIVPAFTWISTANVVIYCGAKVVFVDVDRTTFNIDVNDLKKKITPKTKAIIPVHLFGLCADIDEIKLVAGNIPLVEDGACAAGAGYKGKPAGSLGTIGCFSFHPRKSVTTGEGGMITTNDDKLAEIISSLRNHGASVSEEQRHHGPKPYILPEFNMLGYNYRMTDIQAAVGGVQLKKLDLFIDEREKWAKYYDEQLKDIDWLKTPTFSNTYKHGWQSYVVYIDEKNHPFHEMK